MIFLSRLSKNVLRKNREVIDWLIAADPHLLQFTVIIDDNVAGKQLPDLPGKPGVAQDAVRELQREQREDAEA